MVRKRNIGTVAALGGLTAAVALITALPSARADELGDLRANQELLQRRIDQLAQVPPPPPGGPGGPVMTGSFPRSWLVPGTETSVKIGGEIRETLDYYFVGGNPNTSPQSTTVGDNGQLLAIPLKGSVARSRSNSIFLQSPRETKINFETRTPTVYGEARTVFEFDWAGSTAFAPGGSNPTSVSDNLVPRLRYAYGTLGGFLAGQAVSNFSDPDANPETIDFGGNVGEPGVVRIPQVRYTMPLAGWGFLGALSISAETPETDAVINSNIFTGVIASDSGAVLGPNVAAANIAGLTFQPTVPAPTTNPTKAKTPDLTAAWTIPQPWGHVNASFVLRPGLQFNDGLFVRREFVGYGAHIGMDVKPGWFGWAKDDILIQAVGGDGIGRYLNCNCNFALASNYGGLPAAFQSAAGVPNLAGAGLVRIRTTNEYGGDLGYQHWWTPELRSTVSGGINFHDIPSYVGAANRGALNRMLVSGHANLIWSPVSFVDVGVEYIYGYRQVVNLQHGDMHAMAGRFAVKF